VLAPDRASTPTAAAASLARGLATSIEAARSAIDRQTAIAFALVVSGVVLWSGSVGSIPLSEMTDTGLASVLPPGIWISMALVTAGCAVAWRAGHEATMVLGILATILVFHGPGVLGEPTMRFATTWQHVGIADYIATHGSVNPDIDAYFNWPGFFILSAFLSEVTGWQNIEPLARAAPLFYNAMYLLPLIAIGRALFDDRRLVWLGVWLFFINNWIGQDYYSPQGFAFFLYLVVVAVVLRWFKGAGGPPTPVRALTSRLRMPRAVSKVRPMLVGRTTVVDDVESRPAQRVLLVLAIALIVIVVVATHQLTPFALVSATACLCVVGWCRLRTLPVAILLIAVLWVLYMASTYLSGHLHGLVGEVGAVDSTVSSNVGGRLQGSEGHAFIVKLRLVGTLALWSAAMLGFVRQFLGHRLNAGLLGLAISPFFLLGLQSYGGEVLLRIGLFCLPFMAFAAASLFVAPGGRRASRPALAALACFGAALVVAFPFARYGNERMDYYSKDELNGVQEMYRVAPPGSDLIAGSGVLPWRYTGYADYAYDTVLSSTSPVNLDRPPETVARSVADYMARTPDRRSYLILTRSMSAQADLFGYLPHGAIERLRSALVASPHFRILYQRPDAILFTLRDPPGARP
jgi:hypothetical protein